MSSWKRKGNAVIYNVTIPANSTSTIHFPISRTQAVYYAGKKISKIYEAGAGKYQFEIR
ncbi:alpha-L-rhamnosidase C-terminal domain-containing protein [Pedobacter sp. NJ-S-72]